MEPSSLVSGKLVSRKGRELDSIRYSVLTHAWVNVDFMMDTCMIGFLVPS